MPRFPRKIATASLAAAAAACLAIPVLAQESSLPPLDVTTAAKAAKKKAAAKKAAAKKSAPKAAPSPAPAPPPDVAPIAAEPAGSAGPEVTSTSSATGPVDGIVAKNTLTGSKTNTPISEIPQAISVVGREEIDAQGAQKPDEALRYTAGVLAQPFGPDTDTNWFFIRGFQATQNGIYQDGLPLFSYGFGGFYVDSFSLERIEVLKGASSVLYGGGNPGGLINYVSKKPFGERVRYLESGINDAGTSYLGVDIGDRAAANFDYRISGRIMGGDGYTDFEDGIRGFVNPTFRWHDENTSLTVLGTYGFIDETHKGGGFLPYFGTVRPASFGRIDPYANFTEPSVDEYNREQASVGYELEHKFSDSLIFRQNARYGGAQSYERNLYPDGYDTTLGEPFLNRIDFFHDTEVETFLADTQLEARVTTGPIAHTLLAGVDYKYFNIDQIQSSALFGTTPPISAVSPRYGQPLGPQASYLNQELTQEQIGVYLQEQARFGGGFIVTLNGRYDWVDSEVQDRPTFYAPLQNTLRETSDERASGRAGLGYEFANGLTPYVSWATFFNPQIGTTIAGVPFSPETGEQYEVGFKYAPKFARVLFTGVLFDLTRENVVTPDPVNLFQSVQTGEINSRGFELELKAHVTDNLKVTGALTSYDLEIIKGNYQERFTGIIYDLAGKRPFIVPEVIASASFEYALRGTMLDGVTVGAGVRYLGDSPADSLNQFYVPDVTLVDAKIGYEWNNWGIDLNVTNLFDEQYVSSCQEILACFYGEGRVVKVKTHVTW